MSNIIIQALILFIFWIIVNEILKNLLNKCQNNDQEYEIKIAIADLSLATLSYRKTIMFDIIVLFILCFFDVEFLFIVAIIYYVVIAITGGILIVNALTTELNLPSNKVIIKELWCVFLAKVLNEISDIIMIITFWSFV